MNVLIFSQFAGSAKHGMVFRNYVMAKEWVEQGHSVTIVAGSFAHSRQQQPKCEGRLTEEWIDGIRYIWVKTPLYNADSNFGRVVAMLLYSVQSALLPLKLQSNYDLVIASSPHPFSIYPAYKYARKSNAHLIYDIRDLWPLSVLLLGDVSARHPFIWLLQKAEDFALKHADLVISVPQNAIDYLKTKGLNKNRFLPVANGVLGDLYSEPLPEHYSMRLNIIRTNADYILAYIGAMGTANALQNVIDAMSLVSPNVHLVLIGDGPQKLNLMSQAEKLGLADRIHFFEPVRRAQIAAFLFEFADIGLVCLKASPLFKFGASPTKVNDYMLARLPIVYAVDEPNNAVDISGSGYSCNSSDPEAIANAIRKLAVMDAHERRSLGENGYKWCIQHRLVSNQLRKIEEKIAALGHKC